MLTHYSSDHPLDYNYLRVNVILGVDGFVEDEQGIHITLTIVAEDGEGLRVRQPVVVTVVKQLPPTQLEVVSAYHRSVDLAWSGLNGMTYHVHRATESFNGIAGNNYQVARDYTVDTVIGPKATITNLSNDVPYYFLVTTVINGTDSASNEVRATPASEQVIHVNEITASVAFNKDGSYLASGTDRTVNLWKKDRNNDKYTHDISLAGHTDTITSVAFSVDDTIASISKYSNNIRLWKKDDNGDYTADAVLHEPTHAVLSIAFSPDGKYLVSAGSEYVLRLWKKNSRGNYIADAVLYSSTYIKGRLRPYRLEAHPIAFRSDGTLVSAGFGNILHIWKQDSNGDYVVSKMLYRPYQPPWMTSVAFSADGVLAASSGWSWNNGGLAIHLWEPDNKGDYIQNNFIALYDKHDFLPYRVALSVDGVLAVANNVYEWHAGWQDGNIRLWKRNNKGNYVRDELLRGHHKTVFNIAFSPDGRYLASTSGNWYAVGKHGATIRIWKVK